MHYAVVLFELLILDGQDGYIGKFNTLRLVDHASVALFRGALHCLALPCLALLCLALPCFALPCLALPCLALFAGVIRFRARWCDAVVALSEVIRASSGSSCATKVRYLLPCHQDFLSL